MPLSFVEILGTADWKELTPQLLYYADNLIRRCVWRGHRVRAQGAKVCVEGMGADDFVQDAINRLLTGHRNYNHSVSLEQNLKGIIRSSIWNLNKSCRRRKITDGDRAEGNNFADPIAEIADESPSPDSLAIAAETVREQEEMLRRFELSLSGEEDLLKLLNAFRAEHYTPRSVETYVGIPASRVSELKRRLKQRMERFETEVMRLR